MRRVEDLNLYGLSPAAFQERCPTIRRTLQKKMCGGGEIRTPVSRKTRRFSKPVQWTDYATPPKAICQLRLIIAKIPIFSHFTPYKLEKLAKEKEISIEWF